MSIRGGKFVGRVLRTAIRCSAVVCLFTFASGHAAQSLLNRPAPLFSRPDVNGGRVSLADLRGKVVLLNFWATWCAPCRVEIPRFMQWQQQYGRQGFQVVGISIDDTDAPVRTFVHTMRLNYPVVMGDAELGQAYGGIFGVPVSFLIDRQGIIRGRIEGEANPRTLEFQIRKLLAAQSDVRPRTTIASGPAARIP